MHRLATNTFCTNRQTTDGRDVSIYINKKVIVIRLLPTVFFLTHLYTVVLWILQLFFSVYIDFTIAYGVAVVNLSQTNMNGEW